MLAIYWYSLAILLVEQLLSLLIVLAKIIDFCTLFFEFKSLILVIIKFYFIIIEQDD